MWAGTREPPRRSSLYGPGPPCRRRAATSIVKWPIGVADDLPAPFASGWGARVYEIVEENPFSKASTGPARYASQEPALLPALPFKQHKAVIQPGLLSRPPERYLFAKGPHLRLADAGTRTSLPSTTGLRAPTASRGAPRSRHLPAARQEVLLARIKSGAGFERSSTRLSGRAFRAPTASLPSLGRDATSGVNTKRRGLRRERACPGRPVPGRRPLRVGHDLLPAPGTRT